MGWYRGCIWYTIERFRLLSAQKTAYFLYLNAGFAYVSIYKLYNGYARTLCICFGKHFSSVRIQIHTGNITSVNFNRCAVRNL